MPSAQVGDVMLHYELLGDEGAPPLVMVMGVGTQLIHWPDGLCEELVRRGFRVVRFDNRDSGLSTKLDALGEPPLGPLALRYALGLRVDPPYFLEDMAADVAGLIEALGLEDAHVLGVSMGGMIAQALAIRFPQRVRTLTSLMSTTGERRLGQPRAMLALLGPARATREAAVARGVRIGRALRGSRFPFDEERHRELAERAYDRAFCPGGFKRQMAAILGAGSRLRALTEVRAPTLVVHGTEDPLVPVASGRETARAIPEARLRLIDGLGHELPSGFWPLLADAVAEHALAAR